MFELHFFFALCGTLQIDVITIDLYGTRLPSWRNGNIYFKCITMFYIILHFRF